MKKLKLVLDELRVETFETVDGTGRRGTVVGQAFFLSVEPDACTGILYCVSDAVICAPTNDVRGCDSWVVSECLEC
jgi:hypothetical protein